MTVGNCKNAGYVVAVGLLVLFVAVPIGQCGDATKTSLTKSSDNENSPGLDRIKPLVSLQQQHSAAAAVEPQNDPKSSDEKIKVEQTQPMMEVENSEGLAGMQPDNDDKADDENQKRAGEHEAELRSNTTSSVESAGTLFADRHQGDVDAVGGAILSSRNSSGVTEILHEHVVRHQLHQSSEEDSEEDASFKAPLSGVSHVKNSDVLAANPGPFPVRLGPKTRIAPNSNVNNNRIGGIAYIRKPIPVVRQEAAQTDASGNTDNSNLHDHDR